MSGAYVELDRDKLTRWEWAALSGMYNIADGHAHQGQNPAQQRIIDDLPNLYRSAESRSQNSIQNTFRDRFFELAGQSAQVDLNPPLYHYSSSISIEVVANYLKHTNKKVALIHPTFDNIPAILKRHEVPLYPLDESILLNPDQLLAHSDVDAVFLVIPNNPTGGELGPSEFENWVVLCKERQILIIVDFSFRFFSSLSRWDQYDILIKHKSEFICIEDTGKTWPTLDLKTGFILSSQHLYAPLESISDDILLNISPFILALISEYIFIERYLPKRESVVGIAESNRQTLRQVLLDTPIEISSPASNISVEWIRLPNSWDSVHFCQWLESRQIYLLPGPPFFWDNPERGSSHARIALMRPERFFSDAVALFKDATLEYIKHI
jgi:aspartate/methionine/tyrosine aminotransferase